MAYSSFGWKGAFEGFLIGRTLRRPIGSVAVQLSDLAASRAAAFEPLGDLAAWSSTANLLFAPGCEAQALMLLASFAAPLISLYPPMCGGGLFGLYGARKSGKSTALSAAASVWGHPDGLEIAGRDAGLLKYESLAVIGNLPAIYTGLVHRDEKVARAFLSDLTKRTVPVGRVTLSPQTLVLSTSAAALEDATELGVQLPVFVPRELVNAKDKNRIEHTLIANAGHAGAAYIDCILQPHERVLAERHIASHAGEFRDEFKLTDAQMLQARILGAIAYAARIVVKLGILEFESGRLLDWATEKLWSAKP